jgi:hypothetical protein
MALALLSFAQIDSESALDSVQPKLSWKRRTTHKKGKNEKTNIK